jgi:hypothetical protein
MMGEYNGYLKPYLSRAALELAAGKSLMDVVRGLYAEGVRPPYSGPEHHRGHSYTERDCLRTMWGVMHHALKRSKEPSRRRATWLVWTPELQADELAAECRARGAAE